MKNKEKVTISKKLDWSNLKKMLHYLKPHKFSLIVSLLLLLLIIGLELGRPVVLGRAIDEVLTGYDHPYGYVEGTDLADDDAVQIGDYLVSLKALPGQALGKVIYEPNLKVKYYFVPVQTEEVYKSITGAHITKVEEQWMATQDGVSYPAVPISQEAMKALRKGDISDLFIYIVLFLAIIVSNFLLSYFQALSLNYTGQKIIYKIREDVYGHLQSLNLQFFNVRPVGMLVTRVTNDTETLNEMYTNVIVNSVKSVLLLIGILVMMFALNVKLTLMITIILPFVYLITTWFRRKSRKTYQEVRTKIAQINSFLSEHLSGMKIVQLFSQEERKKEEFKKINQSLRRSNLKQTVVFGIFRPMIYLFYVIGLGIVLLFGGNQVIKGYMTLGVLVMFVEYISNFFEPIQQLAEQFDVLQSAIAASEKIFDLLDEKNPIIERENPLEIEHFRGEIEFKNVWFAYTEEDWVLKDVSFKAKPGEILAFVGATGAGKSSILNLINRYYDIQKGQILVDGIDVRAYSLACLRKNIGQMQQDVFMFTGDIKSNIRLKETGISDELIVEYAKYVNADPFISKLPKGYDEPVYERGATYSTGQRQLISFARTLVANPSILVLDEATSNIDTETELLIQDALGKIMTGRTTLVVAHRLSTIQHADQIIVLHKGRVKEMGKHQELLAQRGIYYELYQLQYEQ